MKCGAALALLAARVLGSTASTSASQQVKACFERQYAEQLSHFTIPHQIQVFDPKPDGDDGFYVSEVVMQISPTSSIYKTVIEPKGETTWTAPQIDNDIDESLLSKEKREEMNARILRFLLTDFTVVAPVESKELNNYLKATARFRMDIVDADNLTVVASGNGGNISFSGVRFFELHSTDDVLMERVFIAGTTSYAKGKERHFKKRREIGNACAAINENAGFVKALRIMETNSAAVSDETLSVYTRNMETQELRKWRERSRIVRGAREKEAQAVRRKYMTLKKTYEKSGMTPKACAAQRIEYEQELNATVQNRKMELLDAESRISHERKRINDAIRENPSQYDEKLKAKFKESIDDLDRLAK